MARLGIAVKLRRWHEEHYKEVLLSIAGSLRGTLKFLLLIVLIALAASRR
jgi:hypothetical protein